MIKKILLALIPIFLIAQFIRPDKIALPIEQGMDISDNTEVPPAVAQALKKACYDCHSNQPEYPWYFAITPVNYYLNGHIRNGSEHTNFSIWNSYGEKELKHQKHEIEEVLVEGWMPLWNYKLLHSDKNLTEEEIAMIIAWAKS